ncbi:SRPBCC family protein [Ornithinimicrobium sp. Y1847]|uniref:SRPBCC family protein n=1 Tax=unclassified Ornithinimicrobium TaxID=2615080 RepID=UPI003B66FDBE
MAMQLNHSFVVPASPERTWALLMDLETVGGCFPGATVTEADEETFKGNVKVKLGPIAVTYQGDGRFVERDDEAHRAVIEGTGKGLRGLGNAGATATMQLTPEGEGSRVDVTTELNITGKPAQFGRGVMQTVSDKLLGQFVQCVESKLGEGSGE